jgi:hypothetical protein
VATNKAVPYFYSNRNLAGMAGAVVGVVLMLAGVAGAYWPVVVVGLYFIGVLVTPPNRVELVGEDPHVSASLLPGAFQSLLATVASNESRIPESALGRIRDIERTLENMLSRPDEVVARRDDILVDLQRLIQTDLPLAVQTYLNMPWWFAAAKQLSAERSASEELNRQLDLLAGEAKEVASRFHQHDLNQQTDHGGYLDER